MTQDELNKLKPGMVVQLNPNMKDPMFACCMLTVTEIKSWGVQGYVQVLGTDDKIGGQAYYRVKKEDIEFVGYAQWDVGRDDEENEV